jgi:hypothetical protein
VERVTGIEPAWPAWKGGFFELRFPWSVPNQVEAVPSDCLSAAHGDGESGISLLIGVLVAQRRWGQGPRVGPPLEHRQVSLPESGSNLGYPATVSYQHFEALPARNGFIREWVPPD